MSLNKSDVMSSRNYKGTDIKADYYALVNSIGRDPLGEAIYGRDKLSYVRPTKDTVAEAPQIKDLMQPSANGFAPVHWFPFANWRQRIDVQLWLLPRCELTLNTAVETEGGDFQHSLYVERWIPDEGSKPGRMYEREFHCKDAQSVLDAQLLVGLELAFFLEG